MPELGTGWVSIVPSMKGFSSEVSRELNGMEPEFAKAGDKNGQTMGSRLMGAAGKTMKVAGVAAGAAAGGAITVGITKGIGRLNAIEQAESKLSGLGNSGQQVGSIMDDALSSVKGTAYGLGDAATVAAAAVAAGVEPGEDLERTLKLVGDSAAIAGSDLSEMGSIFNKVATSGKVQGDVLNQLSDQGIPIVQLLAEELGVAADEVYKLGRDGEIGFDVFRNAIETGMGGAALKAGNTAQGAMANVGAAAGRLGATLAGPFFEQSQGAFVGITTAIDEMTDRAAPAMDKFGEWFPSVGIPAMKDFASESWETFTAFYQSGPIQNALADTARSFGTVVQAGAEIAPVLGQIGTELGRAAGALGLSGWKTFTGVLQIAGTALEAVAGPLGAVADFMSDHPRLVQAAALAYAGFKTIPSVMGKVADGVGRLTGASADMEGMERPAEKMQAAISPLTGGLRDATGTFKEAAAQAKAFGAAHPDVSKLGVATQTLSNNVPFIQRMGDAYQTSSAGLKEYATEQRSASAAAGILAKSQTDVFDVTDSLSRQMSGSLKANIATAAGVAKGTGAAGFSALDSAVGGAERAGRGLLNAFGGPWGATLAIGGAAVATVASEMQRWNRFQEASDELAKNSSRSYKTMFEAIGSGADKVSAMATVVDEWQQSLERVADTKPDGTLMWMQEHIGVVPILGTAINQLTSGWRDEADAQSEVATSAENVSKAMADLGLSATDIATKVTASDAEYKRFTSSLREQGGEAVDLANHMKTLRDGFEAAQDQAKRMGPEASSAAASIAEIAASADDAETKTRNFMRAMAEFNGVQISQAEASGELTRTIDNTTEALIRAAEGSNDFAGATLDSSGMIDTTTTAGDALNTTFSDMAEQMWQAAASGEDAQSVWDRSEEALYGLGEAAGLSKEDVDGLIEAFGLFPETMRTRVSVDGDAAKMELQLIAEQVGKLQGEGPYDVDLKVEDAETVEKLENAGWLVRSYDAEKGEANLYLNDEQSLKKFEWWQNAGFPAIDMAEPTAEANLDTSGLGFNAYYAQMQLDTIDQSRPNPIADMDVSQFTDKQIKMLNDVDLLDGLEPHPEASMDISGLDKHQKAALAMVVDLSGKEAVPIAKMMGLTKFYEDTEDAKRYLNSIPTERNVRINALRYITDVENTGRGGGRTAADDVWQGVPGTATGGRLPKNARGSRLPTSGPGTDRKDGILGVAADGTPMSWVDAGEWIINSDSSEKYDSLLAAINADDVDAIGAALPENAGGGRAGGVSGGAQLSMGMDLEGILAEQAQGSTFDPLTQSWESMAQGMQDAESSLVAPALANVQANVGATGEMFTSTVTGVVTPMVQSMGDHLTAVKTGLMDPAMAGIRDGLDLTGQWTTNAVQSVMNPQWSSMGSHLQAVKDGSVLPTFGGIQSGIDTLAGWFSTGVGNMGDAFGRLRPGTGGPAAFVVRDVFNSGIRGAWNAIADIIDESKMGTVPMGALGAYATGGVLPGYTPGRDVHQFSSPTGGRLMLSGGEAVMRPEWTRAVGGPRAVDEMNAAARSGKLSTTARDEARANQYQAFAEGGIVQAMTNIVQSKYPMLQMTSGQAGRSGGNHGAGRAADFSNGTGNTPQQLALAHDIAKTYPNSLELIYDSPGWAGNIKDGGNVGAFGQFYTMGQAGPHHHHVHWAMNTPPTMPFGGGVFPGGSSGAGASVVSMAEVVKGMWDEEIKKIPSYARGAAQFDKVPAGFQKAAEEKVWAHAKSLADKMTTGPGTPSGAGAERWRPMVKRAFAFQGEDGTKERVDALVRQIWTESRGNEKAIQGIVDINGTGISAGGGLYQFIPSTWAGYRDPRLVDDRFDGWAANNAAVRYFRDRHNWNTGPGGVGLPNTGWKDGGVLPSYLPAALFDQGGYLDHGTAAVNQSGRPEPVFTASQWDVLKQSIASTTAMVDPIRRWVNGGQLDHMAESLDVVAEELSVAYRGGDWGYGELASYIGEDRARWAVNEAAWVGNTVEEIKAAWNGKDFGLAGVARYLGGNEKLAARTLDVVESIGRGVRGVQTGIANFTAGVQKWAAADEDRGRMGTPEELAVHFGGMAAKEFASDALSLVGLDGLADIRFSESFVDLVNEASDAIDDVWGMRLGHITQDSAQPMSVLDDDLRNPNTVVKPVEEETPAERAEDEQDEAVGAVDVEPATVEVEPLTVETPNEDEGDEPEGDLDTGIDPLVEPLAEEESAPVATATAETSQVSITLQGDAYSADEVERMLSQINESVDGIDVRVERLERAQLASVVAGVR